MTYLKCVAALVLAGCAGCAGGEALETSAFLVDPDCDNPVSCPGNSDLLGVLGPYELDETGQVTSSRGFRIRSMTHAGQKVEALQVIDASPRVHRDDGTTQRGANLVGLQIVLAHEGGDDVTLSVDGHLPGRVPYYTGTPSRMEAYHVTYTTRGGNGGEELCPYAEHEDEGVAGNWVVFWKGDRFDPDTGQIFASDAAVGPWFNISCAGEAPIKMMRAKAGGAVNPQSTPAQRQATLNMFTASYCGPTGERYTELGQHVTWSDLTGPNQIGAVSSHEAVWGPKGALCLAVPRMVDPGEINCSIPSCTPDHTSNWQAYGYLLSGNPIPPP